MSQPPSSDNPTPDTSGTGSAAGQPAPWQSSTSATPAGYGAQAPAEGIPAVPQAPRTEQYTTAFPTTPGAAAGTEPQATAPTQSPYPSAFPSGYPAGASAAGQPNYAGPHTGQLPVVPTDASQRSGSGRKVAIASGAVVLALASGGIGGVVGAHVDRADSPPAIGGDLHGGDNGSPQAPPAPAGSVQAVAAKTLPSVVSIAVRSGNEEMEGSGVVLDADGTIMTNNHVVGGGSTRSATRPTITVIFHDGSRAQADLRGADSISDIAVIKVKNHPGLQPINVGTSKNLAVGQDVIAIGSPLGLAGTVTTGIISALNRPVSTQRVGKQIDSVIDAIQTDAAINPGNSGGALVNARGALIGVNTAIATLGGQDANGQQRATGSIGLGFAIPIDQAMRIANQLIKDGKAEHPSLGVTAMPVPMDQDTSGARVATVVPGGAAADAGIPKGAVITRLGGRPITGSEDLVAAVRSFAPGDVVEVEYVAGGKTTTTKVTLKTLPAN
ncbi:trypsin-like peptidase domain-containing protein [Gordonia sp. X0973]|uniref:trypsin-like peptidase domain-containing protein n=1 Tax=Gordonia sp. X0973 TaxID=2742602 RepID=UPI00265733B2|nr:trypsin-like peptidase domain-containing protein [Gordonia sp. X0973]